MAAGNPAEAASDPRVALLADVLEREAGILAREPALLASHLHNMLILDHGTQGAAGHLLEQARAALAGRPWLALTNRPRADRSRHKRVLDHPGGKVLAVAWSPGRMGTDPQKIERRTLALRCANRSGPALGCRGGHGRRHPPRGAQRPGLGA